MALGEIAVAFFELAPRAWRGVRRYSAAHQFWRLRPNEEATIAISLAPSVRDDYPSASPDVQAYGRVETALRSVCPNIRLHMHGYAHRPLTTWDRTVVLIGGGANNVTTRWLQAALDPPMNGYDNAYPHGYDPKGFQCKFDRSVRLDPGRSYDVATVIRAPNPYDRAKFVYLLFGAGPEGTYGAAQWVTEKRNLRWLRRKARWQRIRELAAQWSPADSIQVMLKVPIVAEVPRAEVQAIGRAEVWHHQSGGKHPYFFAAPTDFSDRYDEYVRKH